MEAVLTDNLTMQWGYTLLSTKYDAYDKLSSSLNDVVRGGSCELVALGATTTCLVDLTGNEVEDVPRHQLFAGISWRSEMANGAEFMVDFDVQYQGARWMDEWNIVEIESYMLADLRVGLSRDSWTVHGVCREPVRRRHAAQRDCGPRLRSDRYRVRFCSAAAGAASGTASSSRCCSRARLTLYYPGPPANSGCAPATPSSFPQTSAKCAGVRLYRAGA